MFEAIEIGGYLLWTRLLFLVIAIWMSTEFFIRLSRSAHVSLETFRKKKWQYACAFVGAGRLIAIISEYKIYIRDPVRIVILWDGGFSFLGAVFGIACMLFWYTRTQRTTFLQWLDLLTPAATFGFVFDWIGKLLAGHGYGAPTDLWWGIVYHAESVRFTAPVHPVQLYYAFVYLCLTFVLLIIRKHALRAGRETFWGIVLGTVATFTLEGFRGDPGIIVYATKIDFLVLTILFLNLGLLTLFENALSSRTLVLSETCLIALCLLYFFAQPWLGFEAFELRFSQFLSVVFLCAIVVYVVVHRQKYPHL